MPYSGSPLRRFATLLDDTTAGSVKVRMSIRKAGSADFATGSDWTPATSDVKVSLDGGAQANIGTPPIYSNGKWEFVLTGAELSAKEIVVNVVDSATKAVDDDEFTLHTFGHASAMYPTVYSGGSAGSLLTSGTGTDQINPTGGAVVASRVTGDVAGSIGLLAPQAQSDVAAALTQNLPQNALAIPLGGTLSHEFTAYDGHPAVIANLTTAVGVISRNGSNTTLAPVVTLLDTGVYAVTIPATTGNGFAVGDSGTVRLNGTNTTGTYTDGKPYSILANGVTTAGDSFDGESNLYVATDT